MWSFCKRASGSQQAGKPGVESWASWSCRSQSSFQSVLDPLTLHKQASRLYPHTGKTQAAACCNNYTKVVCFLKRKLLLPFKCIQRFGKARTQRHKLNQLPAWEGRQADTICVEKGLGHGRRRQSQKENLTWSFGCVCQDFIFHAMYSTLCNHRLFTYSGSVGNKGQIYTITRSNTASCRTVFQEEKLQARKRNKS